MKCIKCGEIRESEFYPSFIKKWDYRCKACINGYNKQWRLENLEKCRSYVRKWIHKHPEQNNANFKRWYARNADVQYGKRLAYIRTNPQRHNAQSCAWRKFPIALLCEIPSCLKLGERHHDDYAKPYALRWLCRKHHKELHQNKVLSIL